MKRTIWDIVRLPGVTRPSREPPYSFLVGPDLPPNNIARVAFECRSSVGKSALLQFTLHSPTSKVMYPDIVNGDFGFPTISIKNREGSVYHFARGNIKDFFDISRSNEPQKIELPLSSFTYYRDLKSNVPVVGDFYDSEIVALTFDFLRHPEESVDICLGEVDFILPASSSQFTVQDLVIFERFGQAKQLPQFSTEADLMSWGVSLSNIGLALNCVGARLDLKVSRHRKEVGSLSIDLKAENSNFGIKLPKAGHYIVSATISRDGIEIAKSSWPICRVLGRMEGGRDTILGISDEYEYDRIGAAGGAWDRLPVPLQSIVKVRDGFRFATGRNPLPSTVQGGGRFRVIASFAMSKWMSRLGDATDYYRYGPADWGEFRELVVWLARNSRRSGMTHYEIWNEASALGHWNDDIDVLIELHRISYEAVKAVDPEIVVIGGCTHSWTFEFLRSFLEAGGAQYCDGLAIHGYTYRPGDFLEQFDKLDALIAHFVGDRPNFKAYITEIGFRYPTFSLDDQAKFLTLYTLEAQARRNFGAILWFRYINPRPEILSGYRQNSSTGYALVGNAGSYCRPAFASYRFVERLLQLFDVQASGPADERRYEFWYKGTLGAIGVYGEQAEVPGGWTVLDQYGAQLDHMADLRFAVSPNMLGKLK